MSKIYVVVALMNASRAMVGRSTSTILNEVRQANIDSVDSYIFEVEKEFFKGTAIFDSYDWYSEAEMKEKLKVA